MSPMVLVYVEGRSDQECCETLLAPLVDRKLGEGTSIRFVPTPPGHNKESIVTKLPARAAGILANDPGAIVVAMPDLYPKTRHLRDGTLDALESRLRSELGKALARRGREDDARVSGRFHVFCFKHDLEALLLACPEQLARRLGQDALKRDWAEPVEDQDQDNPPKQVVERLFDAHDRVYVDTVHAPEILSGASYETLAERCPEGFGRLVRFLESV